MEAHRASPAEQWRYGVEWRRTGSTWYTQRRAPHYPTPEGYKGLAPVYAAHRGQKTRELAAPAAYALTGDGKHANAERDPLKMAAARYRDWLAERKLAGRLLPAEASHSRTTKPEANQMSDTVVPFTPPPASREHAPTPAREAERREEASALLREIAGGYGPRRAHKLRAMADWLVAAPAARAIAETA